MKKRSLLKIAIVFLFITLLSCSGNNYRNTVWQFGNDEEFLIFHKNADRVIYISPITGVFEFVYKISDEIIEFEQEISGKIAKSNEFRTIYNVERGLSYYKVLGSERNIHFRYGDYAVGKVGDNEQCLVILDENENNMFGPIKKIFNKTRISKSSPYSVLINNLITESWGADQKKIEGTLNAGLAKSKFHELEETDSSLFKVILNNEGNGIIITGYTGYSHRIRVPSQIQGFPVIEIGESAFSPFDTHDINKTSELLSQVILPEGLIKIGRAAFAGQGITSIKLPETLQIIDAGAFLDCYNLKSIKLPSSLVHVLGDNFDMGTKFGAFQNCKSLKNVEIEEGLSYIGIAMFAECDKLEEITLPNSITQIGPGAFRNSGLKSITFKSGTLSRIYMDAFSFTELVNIEIPEGITTIPERAFLHTTTLTSITFPSTIRTVDFLAFSGCTNLETVIIPESVTSINFRIFNYNNEAPFNDCSKLTLETQALLRRLGYRQTEKYSLF